MGEGQLALGPKLTRPAFCKIKEERKALRYLEVFSMPWSTVHLFLVLLFRKNDIRRSPDIILPQTLQIVLSALPHAKMFCKNVLYIYQTDRLFKCTCSHLSFNVFVKFSTF